MQYRTFGKTGESVSILGYGCMRLPQRLGLVDEARTERQMLSAIEAGVNYFDTAYIYHGGRSETVLGNFLAKGHRDKVFIADKIPPYMAFSRQDMDKILNTQLERLRTDHIDFYLVHSLMSWESWTDFRALGFDDFVRDNLAAGKIRHIGFSWHGNKEDFKRVVDDFDWEFVQIQYNYLDEAYQAGREGLAHAHAKGLGVSIMEPLRGGLLSGRMPKEAADIMSRATVRRTAADWAFNWIWDQPEVSLLLSGMNEESHIAENLTLAEKAKPGQFKDGDHAVIRLVRDAFKKRMKVDCTGCGYCMPCPFGVDIPAVFADWNAYSLFGSKRLKLAHMLMTSGATGGNPSHAGMCRNCGKCEPKCPQHIPIRAKLREAHKELYVPALKPVVALVRAYTRLRTRSGTKGTQAGK
jgi:predicted aldo/keto reductase-like oxidoreductase